MVTPCSYMADTSLPTLANAYTSEMDLLFSAIGLLVFAGILYAAWMTFLVLRGPR
ncbi:hypothetical protein ABIA39_002839 [Nocardia sp. GAS34]